MSTALREFIGRLLTGRRTSYTISLLGLDCAGKTTLLYKLKCGDVMQTIPSIGVNIEDVVCPTLDGNTFHTTFWDVGFGCGGISHMLRIVAMWIERTHAVLWMVDSTDRERLEESAQVLQQILVATEFKNEVPVLVLANKQDSPAAIPLDEVRQAFTSVLSGRKFSVFRCSCIEDIEKGGLLGAFYWLHLVLQSPNSTTSNKVRALCYRTPRRPTADALSERLESWVTRVLEDQPSDAFIEQFHTLRLPSWDHYTHIRIAFALLTKYGRHKGKDMIFNGIERYIRESLQTTGRTYHVTMTYFWVQLVHFGIQSMPKVDNVDEAGSPSDPLITSSMDSASTDDRDHPTSSYTPTPNPDSPSSNNSFARFLVLNPYVVDGSTWSNYYSKEVLMSPAAKAAMVLPDKKPLPNLIFRDVV